jgi:hypothetical protein
LIIPANGASVSGATLLDASAIDNIRVTKVEFLLGGPNSHDTLIGLGKQTLYGWLFKWNTTTVANGSYTLESVAYDAASKKARSKAVSVIVRNS